MGQPLQPSVFFQAKEAPLQKAVQGLALVGRALNGKAQLLVGDAQQKAVRRTRPSSLNAWYSRFLRL
jgi:hypothetical protein